MVSSPFYPCSHVECKAHFFFGFVLLIQLFNYLTFSICTETRNLCWIYCLNDVIIKVLATYFFVRLRIIWQQATYYMFLCYVCSDETSPEFKMAKYRIPFSFSALYFYLYVNMNSKGCILWLKIYDKKSLLRHRKYARIQIHKWNTFLAKISVWWKIMLGILCTTHMQIWINCWIAKKKIKKKMLQV